MSELAKIRLPKSCPFSVRPLSESLYVIHEQDSFDEYPNIYVKLCKHETGQKVIVLSDTGCGTQIKNPDHDDPNHTAQAPQYWNLRTVIESFLNPDGLIPYLVMTTHCHYDHIMGMKWFLNVEKPDPVGRDINASRSHQDISVLSSAYDPAFIHPWKNILRHSLAEQLGLHPHNYEIDIWARDFEPVVYTSKHVPVPINTGLVILQTPGHTPDSLTWYDASSRLICVGDSFYEASNTKITPQTSCGEPRSPIIFLNDSSLSQWWKSLEKVHRFVRDRNHELHDSVPVLRRREEENAIQRVAICAAHVTVFYPDAETYIGSVKRFMACVLRDEVPRKRVLGSYPRSSDVWLWDWRLDRSGGDYVRDGFEWVVRAPMGIIDEGRARIPKEEWA